MGRAFGIKEAEAASVFATTKDQKRTVFAVVGMLGMVVKLTKEINKKGDKLANKAEKLDLKAEKLRDKALVAEDKRDLKVEKLRDKALVAEDKRDKATMEYKDLSDIYSAWDV